MPGAALLMRVAVAALAVVVGVAAVAIARSDAELSLAGDSVALALLELGAGWALVASGLAAQARHPGRSSSALLVAAGIAWFLADWSLPGADSALVFTTGLLLAGACPALAGHAALGYAGSSPRAVVGAAYIAGLLLLGLLPTLVFEPVPQGCLACPDNIVAVGDDAEAVRTLTRIGLAAAVAAAAAAIAAIAWRLARATPARRRIWVPVLVPAAGYLALVAVRYAHGLDRGFVSNDDIDRALWVAQAAALISLAAGAAWERVRAVRTRSALARLVVEIGASPPPGGLRHALARSLDDPDLELSYALPSTARSENRDPPETFVDLDGRPVSLPAHATRLLAGERAVAALVHRRDLLADPAVVREIAAAGRLALEHERLQAGVQAELAALRASRARIVAAGDAERRRLERDLHDGAQQRLVALALAIEFVRREDPGLASELEEVERDLHGAVAELRDLAHGIYPTTLGTEGLAAAVEALAEGAPRLALGELPEERFAAPVETAAYFVVAEALRRSPSGGLAVSARHVAGHLVIELAPDGPLAGELVELEDRVGALGGRLRVDGTKVVTELPCAS